MKMYKEGITRDVDEMEVERFKANGWVQTGIVEEQPKQENVEVVEKKTVRKKFASK